MKWYYVDQGKQAGPVTEEELVALLSQGKISEDTLVWRSGLEQWITYRAVKAGNLPPSEPAKNNSTNPGEVTCVECGKVFPAAETIRHGNVNVCAACKPAFIQKLSEGATFNPQALNYAGIWIRFAAYFVDAIIVGVVNMIFGFISGLMASQSHSPVSLIVWQLIFMAVEISIACAYETIMVGKYGATLGKMACKLKVVTPEGAPVGYGRAFGRYFAKILSAMICLIGFFIAIPDEQKRALHDRICETRVVTR